jgi:hypothetical protein
MSGQQKCKDKVEMWTSKLGKTYRKDQVDFVATAKELDKIRNQPQNRRCADCGTPQGNAWSSVNLGVFTCLRCGSYHRALGTHISKPKGCTGTYLWSDDEVERMRTTGNATADKLYGSSDAMKHLPPPDASYNVWLEFFKDKYERRRWAPASTMSPDDSHVPKEEENMHTHQLTQEDSKLRGGVATCDLLGLESSEIKRQYCTKKELSSSYDFFAQFDL